MQLILNVFYHSIGGFIFPPLAAGETVHGFAEITLASTSKYKIKT